jgi:hypothetical protein
LPPFRDIRRDGESLIVESVASGTRAVGLQEAAVSSQRAPDTVNVDANDRGVFGVVRPERGLRELGRADPGTRPIEEIFENLELSSGQELLLAIDPDCELLLAEVQARAGEGPRSSL